MIGANLDHGVSETVGASVRNEIRKQLDAIAAGAVKTILNEDTVAVLRARAQRAAAAEAMQEDLNADTAGPQSGLEADVDEAPAETFCGNVDEFVREFLVVTYRRKTSRQGSCK